MAGKQDVISGNPWAEGGRTSNVINFEIYIYSPINLI